ncbi:hypothetical protein RB195_022690 [Necator americanus]|uniref:Uncharacterized protein n=1 Tax=Necator americanus TaxID=51031 RepID=A0ABR1EG68_NECAM
MLNAFKEFCQRDGDVFAAGMDQLRAQLDTAERYLSIIAACNVQGLKRIIPDRLMEHREGTTCDGEAGFALVDLRLTRCSS